MNRIIFHLFSISVPNKKKAGKAILKMAAKQEMLWKKLNAYMHRDMTAPAQRSLANLIFVTKHGHRSV